MFDKDRFIEACRGALTERDAHAAIHEVVSRAIAEPANIVRLLGEPKRG